MAGEAAHMHFVNDRPGGWAVQGPVAFPIVVHSDPPPHSSWRWRCCRRVAQLPRDCNSSEQRRRGHTDRAAPWWDRIACREPDRTVRARDSRRFGPLSRPGRRRANSGRSVDAWVQFDDPAWGVVVRPVEEQQFHARRGAGEQAEVCAGGRNLAPSGLLMPVLTSLSRSVSTSSFPAELLVEFLFMGDKVGVSVKLQRSAPRESRRSKTCLSALVIFAGSITGSFTSGRRCPLPRMIPLLRGFSLAKLKSAIRLPDLYHSDRELMRKFLSSLFVLLASMALVSAETWTVIRIYKTSFIVRSTATLPRAYLSPWHPPHRTLFHNLSDQVFHQREEGLFY